MNRSKTSNNRGHLFVISAPSGAGKSTVIDCVRKRVQGVFYSISYTTRPRRGAEVDGVEYHFVDAATFERMSAAGAFLEWAWVHQERYGTPREPIERALAKGLDAILDVDVQGGIAVKQAFSDAVTVFLMPPSLEVLKARLTGRGTERPEQIEIRLSNASKEMLCSDRYDHVIVNDEVERACDELISVIERVRSEGHG